ncbi:MAG: hypothetical protein Q9187_000387 [Circinaria calcarea]
MEGLRSTRDPQRWRMDDAADFLPKPPQSRLSLESIEQSFAPLRLGSGGLEALDRCCNFSGANFYFPDHDFPINTCHPQDKYGDAIPVQIKIGPQQGYLVSAPEHFTTLLKASRSLTPKPGIAITMENMFGTPSGAVNLYRADDSGIAPKPLPGTEVRPEHRIYYHQHLAAHKYLSGRPLQQMTERFMAILSRDLDGDGRITHDWKALPDLYTFWQNRVFRSATEALFGPHLLSLNPTFTEEFWMYISATPTLLKGLPRWMIPSAYRARDRVLESIKKWHRFAREHSDYTKTGPDDVEWDEYWGSKYLKVRQNFGRAMDAMNDNALAAEDLALMVAANANAIVCAAWFLLEIYRDPDLISRTSEEVASAKLPTSAGAGNARFDIAKLCENPLLQSIYAETLRLRIALLLNRTPEHEDFRLGEWLFRKKRLICLSTRTAASNKDLWSTGEDVENVHALDDFWADRFLIYPDHPRSGPLKRATVSLEHSEIEAPIEGSSSTKKAVFSMDGLAGGWVPYGGGQFMCPGRHFAKQEIIGSFAIFCAYYDVELRTEKGFKPDPNMEFFGLGALPPKGQIPFRIRRRFGS